MSLTPLPTIMIEPLVRAALLEDLGRAGDLTSDAIAPADLVASALLTGRQPGVVAGLDLAALAFRLIDDRIEVNCKRCDGDRIEPGETIAAVSGPARAILTAERTALNFLCRRGSSIGQNVGRGVQLRDKITVQSLTTY